METVKIQLAGKISVIIFQLALVVLAGGFLLLSYAQAEKPRSEASHAGRAVPQEASQPLVIGGFDAARGGMGSFPEGTFFSDARAAVTLIYPAVTITGFTTLTIQTAADLDVLVLTPLEDGFSPIEPLGISEQNILYDFVAGGGCAILLLDNADFASANNSLTAPFCMPVSGMIWGWLTVNVSDTFLTPITNGPFGGVSEFTQGWPGGLTGLGLYATGFASNSVGEALAVIPPDEITAVSGAVMVFFQMQPRLLIRAMAVYSEKSLPPISPITTQPVLMPTRTSSWWPSSLAYSWIRA